MPGVTQEQIDEYLEHIRNDYRAYKGRTAPVDEVSKLVRDQMTTDFCESLTTMDGSKYIRVVTGPQRAAHSFILKEGFTDRKGKVWCLGDILKAAGWAAPATNFARGNVVTETYCNITWTGA